VALISSQILVEKDQKVFLGLLPSEFRYKIWSAMRVPLNSVNARILLRIALIMNVECADRPKPRPKIGIGALKRKISEVM
jgi:hypothetical protein